MTTNPVQNTTCPFCGDPLVLEMRDVKPGASMEKMPDWVCDTCRKHYPYDDFAA